VTDEEAIRRLLAEYCQLCDDGRLDDWAELYTEDATFSVMGRTYRGRAELKTFMAQAQPPDRRGKHVAINPLIDVAPDGSAATAATDYVFVGRGADGLAITSAGRYHDRLVREPDRWRFAERRIVFMGEA
jgi:uncharacterized protein (TIGR02246 family)